MDLNPEFKTYDITDRVNLSHLKSVRINLSKRHDAFLIFDVNSKNEIVPSIFNNQSQPIGYGHIILKLQYDPATRVIQDLEQVDPSAQKVELEVIITHDGNNHRFQGQLKDSFLQKTSYDRALSLKFDFFELHKQFEQHNTGERSLKYEFQNYLLDGKPRGQYPVSLHDAIVNRKIDDQICKSVLK